MHGADRDHTVHRLESFSDIVIAFALAETAWNLLIPPHAVDFISHPVGIAAFVITFWVVASFWLTHNAIFRNFFAPNKIMIFLNFVALAGVVLLVFSLQLWLHFRDSPNDTIEAARIYFGIYAGTFGTIALLSATGTFYRWAELTPELRRTGVARSIRVGSMALGAAIAVGSAGTFGKITFAVGDFGHTTTNDKLVTMPGQIILGLIAGFIIGRVLALIVTRVMARKEQNSDHGASAEVGEQPLSS
jgi:uncharacterized membrane protein